MYCFSDHTLNFILVFSQRIKNTMVMNILIFLSSNKKKTPDPRRCPPERKRGLIHSLYLQVQDLAHASVKSDSGQ